MYGRGDVDVDVMVTCVVFFSVRFSASLSQKKRIFSIVEQVGFPDWIFSFFLHIWYGYTWTDLSENGFFGILAILKNFIQKYIYPVW